MLLRAGDRTELPRVPDRVLQYRQVREYAGVRDDQREPHFRPDDISLRRVSRILPMSDEVAHPRDRIMERHGQEATATTSGPVRRMQLAREQPRPYLLGGSRRDIQVRGLREPVRSMRLPSKSTGRRMRMHGESVGPLRDAESPRGAEGDEGIRFLLCVRRMLGGHLSRLEWELHRPIRSRSGAERSRLRRRLLRAYFPPILQRLSESVRSAAMRVQISID